MATVLARSAQLGLGEPLPEIAFHRRVVEQSAFAGFVFFLLVPVFLEELLFRGVLLGWLRGRMGPAAAVLSSALLFAGLHEGAGSRVLAFLIGIALGSLATRAHSIRETLLIHLVYNVSVLAPVLG